MGKLKVAFVGYDLEHLYNYKMSLNKIDLKRIDTSVYIIHGKENIKYVEGNDWLIKRDIKNLKFMNCFPFEGLSNGNLSIIHPPLSDRDILNYFYETICGNSDSFLYFWKSGLDPLYFLKSSLMGIAEHKGDSFPNNILFGLLPPSSIEDLLELKEGIVPERLSNPKLG